MQTLKLALFFMTFISLSACHTSSTIGNNETTTTAPKEDITKVIDQIVKTTQKNICNPNWLESSSWETFLSEVQSPDMTALSAEKFAYAFNRKVKTLPFTHFYLIPTQVSSKKKKRKAPFELTEISPTVAQLTIRSFVADAAGMSKLIAKIQAGSYEKLIIDLRSNHGGTLDAAVVLGQFLTHESIDAGVYISRKWYEKNPNHPSSSDIQNFPFLTDMSYNGFGKMLNKEEAFRMVIPAHQRPTFQGKVVVLTDRFTASTCEPVVDLLQKIKRATIVGEKTAGAMLSGRFFKISSSLKLFVPVADYITGEGKKIDKIGVTPDVIVAPEEALAYALENIF